VYLPCLSLPSTPAAIGRYTAGTAQSSQNVPRKASTCGAPTQKARHGGGPSVLCGAVRLGQDQASAAIFAAFSMASSMEPTM
jgi:hypothetical protein